MKKILLSSISSIGFFTPLALLGTMVAIPQSALAQSVNDEIVVTAQKRSQSAQDVPIAITAFSGEQIKDAGFRDSVDIVRLSPGVNISETNGGATQQFSIRGVTQNDFNDQVEGPNAVYIDEGYLAFGNAQKFGIFDLERVEILKGPQGTLFGRNATGGLIHFISKKPTREVEGFVDASYGSFNSSRVEAAVGGPINETISGRIAGLYQNDGSFFDNQFPVGAFTNAGPGALPIEGGGADDGGRESIAVRGHLLFEPTDEFRALISGAYSDADSDTPAFFQRGAAPVFNDAGQQINTILTGDTPSCTAQGLEDLECSRDFAFEDVGEDIAASLTGKFEYDISSNLTLTAISDYKNNSKDLFLDTDGGAQTFLPSAFDTDIQSFAQEIRLNGQTDKLEWVTGLYYLHIDLESQFALNAPADSLLIPGFFPGPTNAVIISDLDTDSYSAFVHGEYDVTDTVSVIAGLRYTREEKSFITQETAFVNTNGSFVIDTDIPLFDFRPQNTFPLNENLWSGKFQVNWEPNSDTLLYAGVNRGVKAGNFNTPLLTSSADFPDELVPYTQEVLWSYEAGFKADLLNGRLRLNGSAYYYDYKDQQVFLFANITNFIQNADAEYYGVELEALTSPVQGLDIGLSASLIEGEVQDVQLAAAIGDAPALVGDREPSFTPPFQASGFVNYEIPVVVARGKFAIRGDISYSDASFADIRNFDIARLPSFVILNGRISWKSESNGLELYAQGSNLLDERNRVSSTDVATLFGADEFSISRPRSFNAGLRFTF